MIIVDVNYSILYWIGIHGSWCYWALSLREYTYVIGNCFLLYCILVHRILLDNNIFILIISSLLEIRKRNIEILLELKLSLRFYQIFYNLYVLTVLKSNNLFYIDDITNCRICYTHTLKLNWGNSKYLQFSCRWIIAFGKPLHTNEFISFL